MNKGTYNNNGHFYACFAILKAEQKMSDKTSTSTIYTEQAQKLKCSSTKRASNCHLFSRFF